ncbi:MAG: S41 family peptidase [Acidobacteriota bacterium]|nr:S41 family peptidase [Acidobacteriota bacterium]
MIVLLALCLWQPAQGGVQGYYRFPTVHGDTVVFTAEGDLWSVPLSGGTAMRLTTHLGEELTPFFSPDGSRLAFTGHHSGSSEVYVMPASGGLPKRLTYQDDRATVRGWTPDGRILYRTRHFATLPDDQLVKLDPATLENEVIPLAQAADGVYGPKGRTLYFTRFKRQGSATKRYKGGIIEHIWKFDGKREAVNLTGDFKGTSSDPMLWRNRIYFLSDRDGIMNLFSMDTRGGDIQQLTSHKAFDALSASLHDGNIVYQHGADLRRYDIAAAKDSLIPIRLVTDLDQVRERWIKKPAKRISHVHVSPDGSRVAMTARGRVFTAPTGKGRLVEVTPKAGVRWRGLHFSRDGKKLFAVSDKSGENEVWRLDPMGIEPAEKLTNRGPGFRSDPVPSPDGRYLALTEYKEGTIWLVDTTNQEQVKISRAPIFSGGNPVWSHDSQWLAFEEPAENTFSTIRIYNVTSGKSTAVTSDRFMSGDPAWSADGKWLAMFSGRRLLSTTFGPWGSYAPSPMLDKRDKLYLIALGKGQRSPFQPDNELTAKTEKTEKPKDKTRGDDPAAKDDKQEPKLTIELNGIAARLFEVPLPPGNYSDLAMTEKHLYYRSRETGSFSGGDLMALAIENKDPKPVKIAGGIQTYALAAGGKHIMFRKSNEIYVIDANGKKPGKLNKHKVNLDNWSFPLNPREEWAQMYEDSWRLMRDYFYDPDMHGVDWQAMADRFRPLVDRVTTREELEDLMRKLHGELSALHVGVSSGEKRESQDKNSMGFLGAMMKRDEKAGGYRILNLYPTDPDMPDEASPLARPGVDLVVGDVIQKINGIAALSVDHPGVLLRDQAGKQVLLHIAEKSGNQRQVIVKPINRFAFSDLRYDHWEYTRRLEVDQKGNQDLGYVHLRAMGRANYSEWARHYFPVFNRKGLIIDVRHNNGGNIDAWILGQLMRKTWMWWQGRAGKPYSNMHYAFNGHLVVLVDEKTASDGEAFADGFRRLGLGKVIGKRTWGGEIWLSGSNRLVDGGAATAPEFGVFADGEWLIEGIGVIPDQEVDNPPYGTFKGKDAQLEAAVAHLQKLIAEQPVNPPVPPPYPDKSFKP